MKKKSEKPASPPSLVQRKFPDTRFIEFPDVKGKIVEQVQMFSTSDHHSITIEFQDKTLLVLNIEPCFLLEPSLRVSRNGNQEITSEWPPILSSTELS
jgi:hypothetical protein